MNKIYEVKLKDYNYDEYDGWVVIAKDRREVKELCGLRKIPTNDAHNYRPDNRFEDNIEYIKELGTTEIKKTGIVLGSYNAG